MTPLAIHGGTPVIPGNLHRPYPPVGAVEHDYVARALDSGVLWGPWAPRTRELEERWAARIGVPHCVALATGTAALHCAIAGCGAGIGDEVIVPAFSFIATATAVTMAGAIPRFVDVEEATGNIDARQVEAALTPRTRAIVAVHLHGLPADLTALQAIASRAGVALIEDASQAHGATIDRREVGGIGDAGTFSLNATKTLAGPEGGLLTTSSTAIYNEVARMRVFGTEWREGQRMIRDADSLGYNYRIHELTAAFTLARLTAFDEETAIRKRNAERLRDGLAGLPGVQVPPADGTRTHIYQMFRVRLDPAALGLDLDAESFRERVVAALQAEGAQWWIWERKSLPEYTLFQTRNRHGRGFPWSVSPAHASLTYHPDEYPVAMATARDAIFTYGHYPQNPPELIDLYVEAFQKVWRNVESLVMTGVEQE
ncbi:MAG TPA: DegT/DnrJ/EryC1/StrS family aminotransferase [Thermoanaerobaculia bacterium]|nr:DegT/DnrJ/EryC1/StrS family aminotransferase [Thermoanaerobaculia bacterium]